MFFLDTHAQSNHEKLIFVSHNNEVSYGDSHRESTDVRISSRKDTQVSGITCSDDC